MGNDSDYEYSVNGDGEDGEEEAGGSSDDGDNEYYDDEDDEARMDWNSSENPNSPPMNFRCK